MKLVIEIPDETFELIKTQIMDCREKPPSKRTMRDLVKESIIRCLDEEILEIAVQETLDLEM